MACGMETTLLSPVEQSIDSFVDTNGQSTYAFINGNLRTIAQQRCGSCCWKLTLESRTFSFKMATICFSLIYVVAAGLLCLIIYQFSLTSESKMADVIVSAAIIFIELALISVTLYSLRLWYYWMKEPIPTFYAQLTLKDFEGIYDDLKWVTISTYIVLIAFDVFINSASQLRPGLLTSIFFASICNASSKCLVFTAICVDTTACTRQILQFQEKMQTLSVFPVDEYCQLRTLVNARSKFIVPLYVGSYVLAVVSMACAVVLLFLPFKSSTWIILVFLIALELQFILVLIIIMARVNTASQSLTQNVLEFGLHKQTENIQSKHGSSADINFDEDVNGINSPDTPLLHSTKTKKLELEVQRLSLSVVCLSAPVAYSSFGITWTSTKLYYHIFVSASSLAAFLLKNFLME